MERVTQDETSIRPQHDYYPWFLAPALLLLCYWLLERQGYLARFSLILPWRIKEE
jgi:Ca-activated chloride channel family protein